jgi:hypothetical protein
MKLLSVLPKAKQSSETASKSGCLAALQVKKLSSVTVMKLMAVAS